MHSNFHSFLRLLVLSLVAGGVFFACSGGPQNTPLPPAPFATFMKHFSPGPADTTKPYLLGNTVTGMLKGMNDSLLFPYLQPIRSRALLEGRDTICEAPYVIRNPLPVQASAVAYLQYSSSYGFGSVLAKTDRYTAAEVFWGGNKRTYIITYDLNGKIIDALLTSWSQFFSDDSSHYDRTGTFVGCNRIQVHQEGESDSAGQYSFTAFCHIQPDGKFKLDSLRSPDQSPVVMIDHKKDPDIEIVDDYNTLVLRVRMDKAWCNYALDGDATQLQKATFDTLQLDGKGAPEVIVHESRYSMHSYGPVMGGWVTYYDEWFVFNLDTHEILFSAKNRFGRTDLNNDKELAELCEYDVSITREGIRIGTATVKAHKPDHEAGLYVLKEGKYMLQR